MNSDPVRPHIERMLMEIQLSAEGRYAECLPVMESYQLAIDAIESTKLVAANPKPWWKRLFA